MRVLVIVLILLVAIGLVLQLSGRPLFCGGGGSDEPQTDAQSLTLEGNACTVAYSIGSVQYRYVLRPSTQFGERYVLLCGAKGQEEQQADIVVTKNSNLRIVNEFDNALAMKVAVPAGKKLFGIRTSFFYILPGDFVDLRVQVDADENELNPYPITIQVATNAAEEGWQVKTHGDPDPVVKVKGGG